MPQTAMRRMSVDLALLGTPGDKVTKTTNPAYRSASETWKCGATAVVASSIARKHSIFSFKELCPDGKAIYIPGSRLKFVKRVGEGAFAQVVIAEYAGPEDAPYPSPRTIAVKVLKPEMMSSSDDVIAFLEEVRVMHRLCHDNIVEFVGYGSLDASCPETEWRTAFLAQELMPGGSLGALIMKQMVERNKVMYTFSQGVAWCLDVARALAYMHGQSPVVIHRDLKADNILLSAVPRAGDASVVAKIADLGLHAVCDPAKKVSESPSAGGATSSSKWKMTALTGGFTKMSPEVYLDKPYNEKVDVFSFGVCMFEILSKRLISSDYMSGNGWDQSQLFAQRVALQDYRPAFPTFMPAPMRALISSCWAGDPDVRPPMTLVVTHLEALRDVAAAMDAKVPIQACCCIS